MNKNFKILLVFLGSFVAWFGILFIQNNVRGIRLVRLNGLQDVEIIILLLSLPLIISLYYYRNYNEISKKAAVKKVKNESELSEKYSILKHYKKLAYTFMFISTCYALYVIYLVLENNDSTLLLILIVSYSITMFSIFCLIKIIDFLFDLAEKDAGN